MKSGNVIVVLLVGLLCGAITVSAQTPVVSSSVLYVPLIGLTAVPEPLALPSGGGDVTYRYAVKNFIRESTLADIHVIDDHCASIAFVEGDDNGNEMLDHDETWRYICTTTLATTTTSTALVTVVAHDIVAAHKAYATVVVGSTTPAPLVSIVNITKVAYPLALPRDGGKITFSYRVNNPGVVPLSNVSVVDDKCSAMSSKLGDTNGNYLLDLNEVWTYTCTMNLTTTTTNTVFVTAFANGFKAIDSATLTIKVDMPPPEFSPDFPDQPIPSFPQTGTGSNLKIVTWAILAIILGALTVAVVKRKKS